MSTIRNLAIMVETTGRRIPVEEVEGNVTAQELLSCVGRQDQPTCRHQWRTDPEDDPQAASANPIASQARAWKMVKR